MRTKNIFIIAVLLATAHGGALGALAELECWPRNNACTHCTKYKCDNGYYGTATATTNNCVRCPMHRTSSSTLSFVYGTSVVGSTDTTDCYLKNGTAGYDVTGNWVIDTGNRLSIGLDKPVGCYWSED